MIRCKSLLKLSKHMRIAIDARFWGTQAKGLGRYTEQLVRRLTKYDPETEYVLFMRPDGYAAFSDPPKHIRKVLADYRWYSLAEQIYLPRLIRSCGCDLVHFPHFNVPLVTPKPFIVTIHDLILSKYPSVRATTLGPLRYAMKHAAYRWTMYRALRNSRHIITISQFTKRDIIKTYAAPEQRLSVVYEGVTKFPASAPTEQVLQDLHIPKPYLLYVGNAYPHKNLERLIRAYSDARKQGMRHALVLVGQDDFFYNRLRAFAKDIQAPDVFFPGYVSDATLGTLYQLADWYVFPSLYEGFGLPPLEAMAMGTPVMASKASCLPEILGDSAVFFSPEIEHDMIQVLRATAGDGKTRDRCKERSRAVLERYSWDAMCKQTVDIYHKVLET